MPGREETSTMNSKLACLLIAVVTAALGACGSADDSAESATSKEAAPMAAVTGNVFYLQRIALPDDAQVRVTLADVSKMDVAAEVIAEQTLYGPLQVPVPFRLEYDPARIDERMSYSIQARIESGGKLLFITTESHPVITRGNPIELEVRVDPVKR